MNPQTQQGRESSSLKQEPARDGRVTIPPLARAASFNVRPIAGGFVISYTPKHRTCAIECALFEFTPLTFKLTTECGPEWRSARWNRRDILDVTVYHRGRDRAQSLNCELHIHVVGQEITKTLNGEPEGELDELAAALRAALKLPSRVDMSKRMLDSPPAVITARDSSDQLHYEPAPADETIIEHTPGCIRIFVPRLTWRAAASDFATVLICIVSFAIVMQSIALWRFGQPLAASALALATVSIATLRMLHVRFRRTVLEVDHLVVMRTVRSPILDSTHRWATSAIREVRLRPPSNSVSLRLAGGRLVQLLNRPGRADAVMIANTVATALGQLPVELVIR